jgi:hypothetical protein
MTQGEARESGVSVMRLKIGKKRRLKVLVTKCQPGDWHWAVCNMGLGFCAVCRSESQITGLQVVQ